MLERAVRAIAANSTRLLTRQRLPLDSGRRRAETVSQTRVRLCRGRLRRYWHDSSWHCPSHCAALPLWLPVAGTGITVPSHAGKFDQVHTACLNVTCVQCENGKSISTIDSAQATMAHDADTDSDLARPSDGKHPSAQHDTPTRLLRSATRRLNAGHVVAHSGPNDSE